MRVYAQIMLKIKTAYLLLNFDLTKEGTEATLLVALLTIIQ